MRGRDDSQPHRVAADQQDDWRKEQAVAGGNLVSQAVATHVALGR